MQYNFLLSVKCRVILTVDITLHLVMSLCKYSDVFVHIPWLSATNSQESNTKHWIEYIRACIIHACNSIQCLVIFSWLFVTERNGMWTKTSEYLQRDITKCRVILTVNIILHLTGSKKLYCIGAGLASGFEQQRHCLCTFMRDDRTKKWQIGLLDYHHETNTHLPVSHYLVAMN